MAKFPTTVCCSKTYEGFLTKVLRILGNMKKLGFLLLLTICWCQPINAQTYHQAHADRLAEWVMANARKSFSHHVISEGEKLLDYCQVYNVESPIITEALYHLAYEYYQIDSISKSLFACNKALDIHYSIEADNYEMEALLLALRASTFAAKKDMENAMDSANKAWKSVKKASMDFDTLNKIFIRLNSVCRKLGYYSNAIKISEDYVQLLQQYEFNEWHHNEALLYLSENYLDGKELEKAEKTADSILASTNESRLRFKATNIKEIITAAKEREASSGK